MCVVGRRFLLGRPPKLGTCRWTVATSGSDVIEYVNFLSDLLARLSDGEGHFRALDQIEAGSCQDLADDSDDEVTRAPAD